jgi:UDP-3-O-[3-hydroxymyristoyl] N-acetylglucosamine deacetylase
MTCGARNRQSTVRDCVQFEGRGLHTGRIGKVRIRPAPAGHGIIFLKSAKRGKPARIAADWRNIRRLPLCTCLGDGSGNQVRTVEHLMAALFGCGVDNALVEVDGGEIPLMDGSAKPFVDAIAAVGVEQQSANRRVIQIRKALEVADGPRWARIEPHAGLRIEIQTYVKSVGRLPWWNAEVDRSGFCRDIAAARTFGPLLGGIAAKFGTWFLKNPICLGAGLSNTVALFRGRAATPGGLRFPDEFSRHRVLDLVGDLMLAGGEFQGKFTCFSPTHNLARILLQAIFENPECHEVLDG